MGHSIKSIAVIGAGQMGAGIAQVAATAGYATILTDTIGGAAAKAVTGIEKRLARLVEKAAVSADDAAAAMKRIHVADTIDGVRDADLVIEAIIEHPSTKIELFRTLDAACKPSTLLASNTSSISITKLAAATKRPDQFVGMHFMNPVPVMQLVELIRGLQTSDETYEQALAVTRQMGKTPVTARRDYPGFVVNRILIPMLNEACYVLMEGIASAEEIDTAMKLGTNQPMGPLELSDFVGLDTCLAICKILHAELGDDKYRPCPLLIKYVEAGWFGKKSGRGFYQYEAK